MIVAFNFIALKEEKGTGAFRYISRIIKGLNKFEFPNIHFIVYKQACISKTYLGFPDNWNVDYIDVPVIGSGWKRVLFEQTLFYRYLKKCDVFYSYCSSMPLFIHARMVFTLHDVYFITNKERYNWLQRSYLQIATKIYLKRCDTVLTVSEYSRNEIIKYFKIPAEKIRITYNFIEEETGKNVLSIDRVTDYCGKEVRVNKPFFLFIGNIQPSKNIIGMIEGFELFNTQDDFKLFIVGKLSQKGGKILSTIQQKRNIVYLGYQAQETVDCLLRQCKGIVLLSFCEGFGIPPIEGFSCNKPALVSNLTSLPEVVGKAGIKVDPYDRKAIAAGFRELLNKYDILVKNIPYQLAKFSGKESISNFLDAIGVEYCIKEGE